MAELHRLEVTEADGSERLDVWIAARLPVLSRSRAAQLIAEQRVLVDGRPARKSHRPVVGQIVEVHVPEAVAASVEAEALPLSIVFEDEDIVVLDKQAGMVVHPAPGHATGTLVNALLHHVSDLSGVGGVRRPGLVHRLDKDTSGLMLVAKHDAAHRQLSAALKRREIRRRYLAVAWGHLREDRQVVDAPVGRSTSDRKRMAVTVGGRAARTHLLRLERWRAADLVQADLETGRTHQIRVHLASIGHPVVGDAVYGAGWERGIGGADRGWARSLAKRVPRQFLHAAALEFSHPGSGRTMRFDSPLPSDLAAAAAWARGEAGG